jgi:hypothetical protein
MNWRFNLRCVRCGRFLARPADCAVPWGGPLDSEPPEEVYWCARCARQEERAAVARGRIIDAYSQRPKWAFRAARRLGLVLAGSRFAPGSDRWCLPTEVPPELTVLWPEEPTSPEVRP